MGLSAVTLAEGVDFGHPENDPVDLVFAFASPDDVQHVELLGAIAGGIENGLDDALRRAANAQVALAALEEVYA